MKKLSYTSNGLFKRALRPLRRKRPIIQSDMRRIRGVMHLRGNDDDWKMRAIWLAQWKRVMRCGELFKRHGERKAVWDPSKETIRGRIRIGIFRHGKGSREGVKLVLDNNTSKTDPDGNVGSRRVL